MKVEGTFLNIVHRIKFDFNILFYKRNVQKIFLLINKSKYKLTRPTYYLTLQLR